MNTTINFKFEIGDEVMTPGGIRTRVIGSLYDQGEGRPPRQRYYVEGIYEGYAAEDLTAYAPPPEAPPAPAGVAFKFKIGDEVVAPNGDRKRVTGRLYDQGEGRPPRQRYYVEGIYAAYAAQELTAYVPACPVCRAPATEWCCHNLRCGCRTCCVAGADDALNHKCECKEAPDGN